MNEQTTENPAILKKWLQKTRSKDDKEKEEVNMQVEAEEQKIEKKNEEAARKEKQARVHSVFSLVRSQIRTQACLDGQHVGIMDVVKQITKELEKNKKEQDEPTPVVEISSPEENTDDQPAEKENNEEQESEDSKKEKGEDLCVTLLEEILLNLESVRLELRDELAQLRHEMQSYTDQALCGLETRLTNSLRIQAFAHTTTLPRNHVAEPMETKKQRLPSMPPLGTSRRRVLNRTMTTITPKSCLPLSLGPRSNSEPLGAWRNEMGANNSPPRREEVASHPPLGPLPPAIPPAQKGKKTLRSRTRIGKGTG